MEICWIMMINLTESDVFPLETLRPWIQLGQRSPIGRELMMQSIISKDITHTYVYIWLSIIFSIAYLASATGHIRNAEYYGWNIHMDSLFIHDVTLTKHSVHTLCKCCIMGHNLMDVSFCKIKSINQQVRTKYVVTLTLKLQFLCEGQSYYVCLIRWQRQSLRKNHLPVTTTIGICLRIKGYMPTKGPLTNMD